MNENAFDVTFIRIEVFVGLNTCVNQTNRNQ